MKKNTFNCTGLNKFFGVEGDDLIEIEEIAGTSGCDGELNAFYGKKHTEETKQKIRENTLKLCENEKFRMTRANYGENNGMYKSARFGNLNPMYGKKHTDESKKRMQEKSILKYQNGWVHPRLGTKLSDLQKNKIADKNSKFFELKNPDGQVIVIKNLAEYSRKHNLSAVMLSRVAKGIAKKHKGYTKP